MDDSYNNCNVDDVDDDIEWRRLRWDGRGGCLSQNFVLALLLDGGGHQQHRWSFPAAAVVSWGACHGAHPVPTQVAEVQPQILCNGQIEPVAVGGGDNRGQDGVVNK